ncbi:hypothetical protein JOD53_002184 [Brevibacterium luteolum]|nr:hypothetical protein [Brevibacterium luteolum]
MLSTTELWTALPIAHMVWNDRAAVVQAIR